MNMTVAMEMPEDILLSLPKDPRDVADAIRMAAAVKLYELGRLSSGAAAEMAGLPGTRHSRLSLPARRSLALQLRAIPALLSFFGSRKGVRSQLVG